MEQVKPLPGKLIAIRRAGLPGIKDEPPKVSTQIKAWGRTLIRQFAIFLGFILSFLPIVANAASPEGVIRLSAPCVLQGHDRSEPTVLLRSSRRFECSGTEQSARTQSLWLRFDLSDIRPSTHTGWTYDHGMTQARDERVWFHLVDGRILQSPTTREGARKILGGPTQRFLLPPTDGRLKAILVRVDGLENRRGAVPRAMLTSLPAGAAAQASNNLVFGILAGVLAAILFYNITLYSVLRHKVLAAFCWPIAGAFFYGLVWSNLILMIVPAMTTQTQFGWNAVAIAFCFWATAIYFRAIVEPEKTQSWALAATGWLSILLLAITAFRLLPVSQAVSWWIQDYVAYATMLGMIGLLVYNSVVALRLKSRAIRFFLLGWSPVIVIALARLLWGIGELRIENALFDASSFIAMSLQAILSSVTLAWKFREMQQERDVAVSLAETDSLSGLLNRRAMLEAAMGREGNSHLVLVDVDHFKQINDQHGHDVGDKVIIAVARILRNFSPEDALVGRLGGDEFAVIVRAGVDPTLADRLRRVVARAEILAGGERVTICAGQAEGPLKDDQNWKTLYIAADRALYAAKRGGRDRVSHADLAIA